MIDVFIITGGKKENSTKRLSFEGATPYQCALKTPTSIERPVITLTTFILGARYAYIPSFSRYYFIEDIVCAHNQTFNYYLSIDVLGTYRDELLLYTLYSVRSSAGSRMLPDPMYTHKNNLAVIENNSNLGMSATGSYVLATVGGGAASQAGSVLLYLVTPDTLQSLMAEIFNPSASIYGDELQDDITKTYFNPFQYIVSCHWVPFASGSGLNRIKFGFWESTYMGTLLGSGYEMGYNFTGGFTIPKVNGDDYTSFSPGWVRHDLYVPGFGNFPIDPKYSGKQLYLNIWMDWATGQANCDICTGSLTSDYVGRMSGQLGIPIQLSQLAVDSSNIGTNIIGGLEGVTGGFFSKGLQKADDSSLLGMAHNAITQVIGMAGGLLTRIPGLDGSSLTDAMSPTLESCGTNGNRFYIKNNIQAKLTTTYFSPDNANDVHGMFNYPDDRERRLDTLNGYAIFKTDAVGIGNAAESAAILAHLNGGVYLE